jgi:hypothetical protein
MAKLVMLITDATVKIATGSTEPADWSVVDDFKCQVTEASIGVQEQTATAAATYCEGETDHARPSKWNITLAGLQDWNADADSVSMFLFDNDANPGWIQIAIPDVTGTGNDIATATAPITIRAGQFSGPAGTPLVFSTTLPCSAKPEIVKSTVA